MKLRRFKKEDLEEMKRLIDRTIKVSYKEVYPDEAIAFFMEYHSEEHILDDAEKGYSIVVVLEGRIVGTGTLLGTNVRRVFVDPSVQRRGIGKRIMGELEGRAKRMGVETVDLDSSLVSKEFYDSLNYICDEETFISLENDQRLVYYKMKKRLT